MSFFSVSKSRLEQCSPYFDEHRWRQILHFCLYIFVNYIAVISNDCLLFSDSLCIIKYIYNYVTYLFKNIIIFRRCIKWNYNIINHFVSYELNLRELQKIIWFVKWTSYENCWDKHLEFYGISEFLHLVQSIVQFILIPFNAVFIWQIAIRTMV